MDTKMFRTQQEIIPRKNAAYDGCWLLGIDAGYSSIKGFSPNKIFTVPSYVKKMDSALIFPGKKDILYRDETGTYMVGMTAQEQVSSDDTSDTEAEMFGRNRFRNKKFLIQVMTGIAIGMMDNAVCTRDPSKPVLVQTGLPPADMLQYESAIKKAFSTPCSFQLKIGEQGWQKFDIRIKPEHVFVVPQPSGTLYSIMVDKEGKYLSTARSIMQKNILIVDAGFSTFDPYGLANRKVVLSESFRNLGMNRILQETSKLIYKELGEDIRVAAMQKLLGKGSFKVLDEETMQEKDVLLGPYLNEANQLVCSESLETLKSVTNFFRDYDQMVLTGGTCASWFPLYREYLSKMRIEVVAGNQNDNLPMMYSNVRGYYMLRMMALKAGGF